MFAQFLTAVPSFFAYFGIALALLAVFLLIYVNLTPYQEFALIRAGNPAAAISLSGALIGFVLPIANAIAHAGGLLDLVAWGSVAGLIQIAAYLVVRLSFPQLREDIPAGRTATAVFLASLSLAVGILNAACMTY